MALYRVSQLAIDQVLVKLADPLVGFNPGMLANANNYQLTNVIQLNFDGLSQNFFQGQVSPDDLEETSPFTYPMACLYVLDSEQIGTQKFTQFSGALRIIFDVYLSWTSSKAQQNFDSYPSCVEDVVVDIINRQVNQTWAFPLVYNGQLRHKRGPVKLAAQNFRQQVAFAMNFEWHQ